MPLRRQNLPRHHAVGEETLMPPLEPLGASIFAPSLAEQLYTELSPRLPGITIELLESVDSTNTRLLARAQGPHADVSPCLMVAAEQTAGRGRLGRRWVSQPGGALTFSLAMPLAPKQGFSGLSLAIGVAVARALDPDLQHGVLLKWPNDVWLWPAGTTAPAKLAGILIETASMPAGHDPASRWVVVGIGLNLDTPQLEGYAQVDGQGNSAATQPPPVAPVGWRQIAPNCQISGVLSMLQASLLDSLLSFQEHGWAGFASAYAQRDGLSGRSVQLWEDGAAQRVDALGVAADGSLRVRDAKGAERALLNGEISIRL
jgi:BirA family transcriptional regulator, biotin operon repressor / biotin---[acetyl-CoA-carboxylase] ligase